jgi:two-component sensor histidine kinase
MLDLAISLADADMGNIQALDSSTRTLRIVAHRGFERPFLEFFGRVEPGEAAVCGAALAAGAPVLVPDVEESPVFRGAERALEVLRGAGVRAVMSVPAVNKRGEVIGMLSVHYRTPRSPPVEVQRQLGLLSRQAGVLMEELRMEEALRASEEKLRVLVDELQHRARNLLAVIRAIAGQLVERAGTLEAFRDELDERLAALSRVQGLLSRSQNQSIPLDALIRSELDALGAPADGGRITLDGPPVPLGGELVQTLALALHELATNAYKHGALATAEGRLGIAWWDRSSGEDGRRLELRWVEERTPRAGAGEGAPHIGFGRELIEHALPYTLGAKTRFDLLPGGLRCTIELPLATSAHGAHATP